MSAQEEGIVGKMVGAMMRRSVRRAFRTVYWIPPAPPIQAPAILVPNHHGWHDGYLMFHAIERLGLPCLDWIAEYDAFPAFSKIGGMPFPVGDPVRRAETIRRTIRLMRDEQRSLVLFAEGVLHQPPKLLPFGRALEVVARAVEGSQVIPVGIKYEMSLHERPEAFLMFGHPIATEKNVLDATHDAVQRLLGEMAFKSKQDPAEWQILVQGTLDVNERWDVRRIRGKRHIR